MIFGYDAADRLLEYAVSGGPVTDYTYFPDGSVDTISWTRIPGLFHFTYTLTGQYDSITMPNGQHRDFEFDDQGRLSQIANIGPASQNLATYDYGYDTDYNTPPTSMIGQRTSMTATVPFQGFSSSLTKYYYDPLYELKQTDYPNLAPFNAEVASWTYDTIGDRLSETINGNAVSYSYPPNSELLSGFGSTTISYDGNKNFSNMNLYDGQSILESSGFGWNERNKLSSISTSTIDEEFHNFSYTYDFRGRRTSKTVDGISTTFLYAGQNLIAQTNGSTTSEFLFAPGIDKPLAAYIGGSAYYYSVDGLGSVALLTNTAGAAQNSYVYDVWGNTRAQTVNVPQPFVYTAREAGEDGLLYYRARYYNPAIGRFISQDPVRYADFGLYPYVGNDPVSFIDPSGLKVTNNSPCPIVVKPEHDEDPPVVLGPGEVYDEASQDGVYTIDGKVFKSTDYIDVTVTKDGTFDYSSGLLLSPWGNVFLGYSLTGTGLLEIQKKLGGLKDDEFLKQNPKWPSKEEAKKLMEEWLQKHPECGCDKK